MPGTAGLICAPLNLQVVLAIFFWLGTTLHLQEDGFEDQSIAACDDAASDIFFYVLLCFSLGIQNNTAIPMSIYLIIYRGE